MSSRLQYCPEMDARLERLRSLYTEHRQDRVFARMDVQTDALRDFAAKHAPGYTECPDLEERATFWDHFLAERALIHDDSIPSAYLSEMDKDCTAGLSAAKHSSWRIRRMVGFPRWFHPC